MQGAEDEKKTTQESAYLFRLSPCTGDTGVPSDVGQKIYREITLINLRIWIQLFLFGD